MRPRMPFPEGTQEHMEKLLKQAKTAEETKRIQCILLRVREDYENSTIAQLVGYSEDSVKNIHSRFIRHGEVCLLNKQK
jgi:DNA-directed RNA polymerase specialized sigma24 family protein